jgi:hypothetical protein
MKMKANGEIVVPWSTLRRAPDSRTAINLKLKPGAA